MKTYNKIVRDNIPNIIENEGKPFITKIVTNPKAIQYLIKKISEETEEFQENMTKEEMADILEVIYSIIEKLDWSIEEIEKLRIEKRNNGGGFKNNNILLWVDD